MDTNIRKGRSVAVGFCLALAVSAAAFAVSTPHVAHWAAADKAEGGYSVHFKNGRTPEWMVERQSQSAGQMPEFAIEPATSYWI